MNVGYACLKSGTLNPHTALEQSSVARCLMSDDPNRDAYLMFLRNMYDFHLAVQACTEDRFREDRIRLAADIRALDPASPLPEAPSSPALAVAAGSVAALGVRYVVEGSRLGALHIAGHLQRSGLADLPVTYLQGLSGVDISHWKDFTRYVDDVLDDEKASIEALKGAGLAFAWLQEQFDAKALA
ncbi:MAG: biliverdin-producing heme oxygenase [Halieaceae bacterium]|nr:biliverdin-producing heme oxygenase [Halieaceae bacterium]